MSTDRTEPKGSTSSSPDDPCGRCPHLREDHGRACCIACGDADIRAGERTHDCHAFVPADAETANGRCEAAYSHSPDVDLALCEREAGHPGVHKGEGFRWDGGWGERVGPASPEAPLCRCGHTPESHDKLRRHTCIGNRNLCGCEDYAPEPAAHEHEWTEWGAVYHGGHLQWRDCRFCGDHETRPPEPEAPCSVCEHSAHRPGDCEDCVCKEAEPPPCRSCDQQAETWFDRSLCAEPCGSMHDRCTNCGVTTMPCPNEAPEPKAPPCDHRCSCGHDQQDHSTSGYCNGCSDQCEDIDGHYPDECGAFAPEPKAPPLPRPPYLVSYATGSGAVVQLALPGETTTAVVNGALVICHPSGVLGISQVKPIEMEN